MVLFVVPMKNPQHCCGFLKLILIEFIIENQFSTERNGKNFNKKEKNLDSLIDISKQILYNINVVSNRN